KPISVYGPAIDQGLIGSESRLANYATTYADGREFVNSTTVDLNQFVTVRNALNWSFNIPVVHVINELRKKIGDDNYSYNHYLS
ncbi:penicillin-binding protein, partial [Enterococcus faecalis]